MSRIRRRIDGFAHVVASADGRGAANAASETVNVRLIDRSLRFRRGYKILAPAPTGVTDFAALGLAHLSGYADDYGHREEWISVERRNASVRAYAVNPATGVRTEIKNGTAAVSLEDRRHLAFAFGGRGYLIAPGAARTVYRHEIGDAASLVAIQDTAATPAAIDPDFDATARETTDLAYSPGSGAGADVIGYSDPAQTSAGIPVVTADAIELTVTSVGSESGDGQVVLTVDYATAYTIDGGRLYCSIAVDALGVMRVIREKGALLELKVGGVYFAVTSPKVSGGSTGAWALSGAVPSGVALPATLQGFRLTFRGSIYRVGSKLAKVYALQFGGNYLTATTGTQRGWLNNVPQRTIVYGARTRNTSTGAVTEIKQEELSVAAVNGPVARNAAFPIGNLVTVHFDAPVATDVVTQFLRKDANGIWRKLNEQPAGPGLAITDGFREDAVQALPAAEEPLTATGLPTPTPPFSGRGIVAGFAHKGWAVWLRSGGKGNVCHSKIGNAEEIKLEDAVYDTEDPTAPDNYSMAEDFGDEPIGGVSAGGAIILLGRSAAYSQSGDEPGKMSPVRQIAGSMPPAGPRAFARFRPAGGDYGCAYLDRAGNVWFLQGYASFESDATVKPAEISIAIRGLIARFLVAEQLPEFPGLSLADAEMAVDQADGSLSILLGRRRIVGRPLAGGGLGWEPEAYNLAGLPIVTETWTAWSAASDEATQLDGGANWTEGPPDLIPVLNPGATSKRIRRAGFLKGLIPAGAEVSEVEARIVETSSGPIVRTAHVEALNTGPASVLLFPTGTNALSFASGPQADYDLIEAGGLGSEIRIENTENPLWADPANWSFTWQSQWAMTGVPPPPSGARGIDGTETLVWHVRATFTHPSPPPSLVRVAIDAAASMRVGGGGGNGPSGYYTGSATNGVGQSGSASVGGPSTLLVRSTGVREITLVNRTGTTAVSMTCTAANLPNPLVYPWYAGYTTEIHSVSLVSQASYSGRVEMRARVAVTTLPPPVSLDRVAFDAGDALRVLRSDGAIVDLERDPLTALPIEGTLRDGGSPPPAASWRSTEDLGPNRRMNFVTVHATAAGSVGERALAAKLVGAKAPGAGMTDAGPIDALVQTEAMAAPTVTPVAPGRSAYIGPEVQGASHFVTLRFTESTESIRSVETEATTLSKQYDRGL